MRYDPNQILSTLRVDADGEFNRLAREIAEGPKADFSSAVQLHRMAFLAHVGAVLGLAGKSVEDLAAAVAEIRKGMQ